MTYPVYAQKARLPQWRPRFLFYRPARSIIRVVPRLPRYCLWAGGFTRHRGIETPRLRDAKTLKHRNSETLRHQNHTPPRRPSLRAQPADAPHSSHDRQRPLRPQPAIHRAGAPHLPAPSKNAPSSAPPQKNGKPPVLRQLPDHSPAGARLTSAPHPTQRRDGCCDVCGKP